MILILESQLIIFLFYIKKYFKHFWFFSKLCIRYILTIIWRYNKIKIVANVHSFTVILYVVFKQLMWNISDTIVLLFRLILIYELTKYALGVIHQYFTHILLIMRNPLSSWNRMETILTYTNFSSTQTGERI